MNSTTQNPALGLSIVRELDATPELVWRAWTESAILLRWFCPKGFVATAAEIDLRVGGRWATAMRSPEGDEYHESGEVLELEPPRLLVMTHIWDEHTGDPGPRRVVRVMLEPSGQGTRLTFEHAPFADESLRDSHLEGWGEALDNLAVLLAGGL